MVWQLGTVPYLNAEPLAAALREPDAALLVGDAVGLQASIPAELLPQLLSGSLDAALVSTAGVLPYPELRIVPGMCVSSRGVVESIELYCRRPPEEVRTVALDASSRSGLALTRVLFAERWRRSPEFITLPPVLPEMLRQADAALLIGNPALQANVALERGEWPGLVEVRYDLGEEWDRLTGLPFVYAVWASPVTRNGAPVDHARLTRVLEHSLEWGLRRRGLIASRGAEQLSLPRDLCDRYLNSCIRYRLGPDERAGMELFCRLAVEHGVLPPESAVRFVEPASAAVG
jgi:chorismate dehydratase